MLQNINIPDSWDGYYDFDTGKLVNKFTTLSPEELQEAGGQMRFSLFHQMAQRVPAYKEFLSANNLNPDSIKKPEDIERVPCIDKENYVKRYSLEQRSWDGKIDAPIISASSGSSGAPTYWPRSDAIELETTYIYELFLRNVYEIDKYKTLLVNGFSMGIYIGGTFTLNCCMRIHQKGFPLTIITPGISMNEIVRSVAELGDSFGQIILSGYPPFIRDILDEGEKQGVKWKKYRIRFYFASESLSEEFRTYLYDKAGIKEDDYYTGSLNLYGTADAAIAGHEMPLGTLLRTAFSQDNQRCLDFFGKPYVPSINQYYPFFKYFETIDGELVFSSANNAVPLLRYNIHDRGGILQYGEMLELLKSFGYSLSDIEKKIKPSLLWHLPYVYLFGRSDFTVTLYGLNVYPENIKAAVEDSRLIELCTGKFVMETANKKHNQSQYLLIHIELKNGIDPKTHGLKHQFKEVILQTLRQKNSEYNHLFRTIGRKAIPEIDLRKYADNTYFSPATKQKWVKKNDK